MHNTKNGCRTLTEVLREFDSASIYISILCDRTELFLRVKNISTPEAFLKVENACRMLQILGLTNQTTINDPVKKDSLERAVLQFYQRAFSLQGILDQYEFGGCTTIVPIDAILRQKTETFLSAALTKEMLIFCENVCSSAASIKALSIINKTFDALQLIVPAALTQVDIPDPENHAKIANRVSALAHHGAAIASIAEAQEAPQK